MKYEKRHDYQSIEKMVNKGREQIDSKRYDSKAGFQSVLVSNKDEDENLNTMFNAGLNKHEDIAFLDI